MAATKAQLQAQCEAQAAEIQRLEAVKWAAKDSQEYDGQVSA